MGDASVGGPVCSNCGLDRADNRGMGEQRPPCPRCGEQSVTFSVQITDAIGPTSDDVGIEMTPGDQTWDWRARWEQVLREFAELVAPRTDEMGAEGIRAARYRLNQFYISAFHLKDALKKQTTHDVEKAINATTELAILADLANSEKHDGLDPGRRTHSGHEPRIKKVSGTSLPAGGWKVVVVIEHDGKELDGIAVAESALDAWRRVLGGWGLLRPGSW